MPVDQIRPATWDGLKLVGWLSIAGKTVELSADLDTIHRHAPGFNNALTWEVKRHAVVIFDKLRPYFLSLHT